MFSHRMDHFKCLDHFFKLFREDTKQVFDPLAISRMAMFGYKVVLVQSKKV